MTAMAFWGGVPNAKEAACGKDLAREMRLHTPHRQRGEHSFKD